MMTSLENSNEREPVCTPIVVDSGFVLDPSSVLHSAKQLATACKRNVLVRLTARGGAPSPTNMNVKYEVLYYIQPDKSGAFSEVTDTRILTIE
jgi:hypothetical protein